MKSMTPDELKKEMEAGDVMLIDVREQSEWDESRIKGATLIPMATLPLKIEEFVPNKDQKLVLHCKSGGRSSQSVMTLEKMGYTNVYNLEGGILATPDDMKE